MRAVINAVRQRFAQSIFIQYIVYLFAAMLISLGLSVHMFAPTVEKLRVENTKFFARVALLGSVSGLPSFDVFKGTENFAGLQMWVVDAKGSVLRSSANNALPVPWEKMKLPSEEMDVAVTNYSDRPLEGFTTVRLIKRDPTYLIFHFSDKSQAAVSIGWYVTLLVMWMFLVSLVGMFFLLHWKEKKAVAVLKSEGGFSLVTAIVSIGLVALAMAALQSMLTVSLRGNAHADLRSSLRSLSDSVKMQVDCQKTFEGLDLNAVCNSRTALVLKDQRGAPITEPLRAGMNSPLDPTTKGAGRIGNWHLRAYCDSPNGNLVIRFARVKTEDEGGNATFVPDPLLKRPFDWTNSDINPLFGVSSRQICSGTQVTTIPPTTPPVPPPPPAIVGIKRMASIVLNFRVANTGYEMVEIDLTQTPPKITPVIGTSVTLDPNTRVTGAFEKTIFHANVAIRYADLQMSHVNTTATPIPAWDYPNEKPGVLRVRLNQNTDVKVGTPLEPIGSLGVVITAFQ